MRLLLDTHIFIWWDSEPAKLPPPILAALQDPANELMLSVASIWEIQIKAQLGKLRFQRSLSEIVASQQHTNGIEVLPIATAHVYALDALPLHHRDPFDRMLIAQSSIEGLILVSVDPIIRLYHVSIL